MERWPAGALLGSQPYGAARLTFDRDPSRPLRSRLDLCFARDASKGAASIDERTAKTESGSLA